MTLTVEYHKFLPTTVREKFLLYYKIISKAYYKDFYSINFYFINGMTSHKKQELSKIFVPFSGDQDHQVSNTKTIPTVAY